MAFINCSQLEILLCFSAEAPKKIFTFQFFMMNRIKRIVVVLVTLTLLGIMLYTLRESIFSSGITPEEKLARQYCGSCHLFPDPSLLDKATWDNSVLPQMAFRMGFEDYRIFSRIAPEDRQTVTQSLPAHPMVTTEQWTQIRNYFIDRAPESLQRTRQKIADTIMQFVPRALAYHKPFVTLLKYDSINQQLYIGHRLPGLDILNKNLQMADSFPLNSPPSYITFSTDRPLLSLLGILLPNDQAKGELINIEKTSKKMVSVIDSIQRPVFFEQTDINNDGFKDIIVCAFGHFTGSLLLYKNMGDNKYSKHFINTSPGARKVIVQDFNGDGRKDILTLMTQGDERIILYTNKDGLTFEEKILLRFPPVYGSNYFEIADFNNDGNFDILFTNGDNGDFSVIVKPYHAVRVFTNDGRNNFKETWSYAMPGASQAAAKDFDGDGDLDIAAISFFPDFENSPENGFIYFENRGNSNFNPQITPLAASGRWLVMETADHDRDGDTDIFIGSLSFRGLGASNALYQQWLERGTSVLFFENTMK
jgi:hypothetical protein